MAKKCLSILLLVSVVVSLLPICVFSVDILSVPEVRDSSGFALKTNEIIAAARKIVLVFDEDVIIDIGLFRRRLILSVW